MIGQYDSRQQQCGTRTSVSNDLSHLNEYEAMATKPHTSAYGVHHVMAGNHKLQIYRATAMHTSEPQLSQLETWSSAFIATDEKKRGNVSYVTFLLRLLAF